MRILWLAVGGLALSACGARAQPANLLPNPSFELVEPPAPTAQQPAPPAEAFMPRTWSVWGSWGGAWVCPDDPAQARTGRRAVRLSAKQGQAAARYGVMPVPDREPWTIGVWARGEGKLAISVTDATGEVWKDETLQTFDLSREWTELNAVWTPPEGWRKWCLTFVTSGPGEAWLDDASLSHPASQAPPWPPAKPLGKDEHTLLYLDFEQPLNEDAFYVGGQVGYTDDNQPGFGKALALGAEAYVACSADQGLNPRRGTIEMWVKLVQPGNDGIAHGFLTVPGPEGMWLGKDQYSHVGLHFSTGWGALSHATAMGYAWNWQPRWRQVAACWDETALQVFVDGKLIAWQTGPKLSRALGPELRLGGPGVVIDDLRVSDIVRYRALLPAP